VIVARPWSLGDEAFEQRLFVARREVEALARSRDLHDLYVASLSHRTIVYKALLRGPQLREFYDDLKNPAFVTPFAVFHNRFSTNTNPSWPRTQPFRLLAHNGDQHHRRQPPVDGGRDWRVRAPPSASVRLRRPPARASRERLGEPRRGLPPHRGPGARRSSAIRILIPPAWENDRALPRAFRAFNERASAMMEPGWLRRSSPLGRPRGRSRSRSKRLRPARSVITTCNLITIA
jgi:glutamate synthase domain-containing protein 1